MRHHVPLFEALLFQDEDLGARGSKADIPGAQVAPVAPLTAAEVGSESAAWGSGKRANTLSWRQGSHRFFAKGMKLSASQVKSRRIPTRRSGLRSRREA